MTKLSQRALDQIRRFSENTYAMPMSLDVRQELIEAKLVEWKPPPAWQTNNHYGLTEAGWEQWRALRMTHPNGAPMFAADGTMLDDKGNRSIFDDVDE